MKERVASKDATLVFHNMTDAMDELGADLIKIIKAFAAFQNDPNVYALAGIPAPASPTPVPAPGTPTAFEVMLEPTGALRLAWQCNNPTGATGTVYEIQRRIGSAAESVFTFVGSTGKKFFTDSALPPGACGGEAGERGGREEGGVARLSPALLTAGPPRGGVGGYTWFLLHHGASSDWLLAGLAGVGAVLDEWLIHWSAAHPRPSLLPEEETSRGPDLSLVSPGAFSCPPLPSPLPAPTHDSVGRDSRWVVQWLGSRFCSRHLFPVLTETQ